MLFAVIQYVNQMSNNELQNNQPIKELEFHEEKNNKETEVKKYWQNHIYDFIKCKPTSGFKRNLFFVSQ